MSDLTPSALELEKRKDYRNTVLAQGVILVLMMTFRDVLDLLGIPLGTGAWPAFLAIQAGYFYLLWDLLRDFTRNPWLVRGLAVLVALMWSINLIFNFLLWGSVLPRVPLDLCLYGVGLTIQMLVAYHALRDLFRGRRNTADKLWGSACVYLLSGFIFAGLFHVLHLIRADAFGVPLDNDFRALPEALYFSFTSLVGLNTVYSNPIHLVRNLSMLEGCWGQLYLVLLIARVMLPDEPESSQAA